MEFIAKRMLNIRVPMGLDLPIKGLSITGTKFTVGKSKEMVFPAYKR